MENPKDQPKNVKKGSEEPSVFDELNSGLAFPHLFKTLSGAAAACSALK
jgi:hypothetical protein